MKASVGCSFSMKHLCMKTMAFAFAVILILLATTSSSASSELASQCYESIISFGDSLADTGNCAMLSPDELPPSSNPPFGRSFFDQPTGRFSDGRVILDFIAERLGLPLLHPYAGGEKLGRSFRKGVNFAVAAATAKDHVYYEKMGFYNRFTNVSLETQLDWFKQFLATIPDGREFLQKSLVIMGEIGNNDYNYAIMQRSSLEEILSLFPPVIDCIGSTIEELIKLGAKTLLVAGNLPIGCIPMYLTEFKTSTVEDYDPKTGCLNWLNKLSSYHNELLQKELSRIQELYPHVNIIYGDYYNSAMRFYLSPNEYGFTEGALKACCGAGGGPYNFNGTAMCSFSPSTSCNDPSLFASWDGIHLTETANKLVVQGFFEGPYTTPHITTICPSTPVVAQAYEHYEL